MKNIFQKTDRKIADLLIRLIQLYQKTISPEHSRWGKKRHPFGACKFYPSCSEYTKIVLKEKGFFRGIGISIWRILRCHPWSEGGIDQP